jgi:putative spermidine/putrescine transport system substrate-binding protein
LRDGTALAYGIQIEFMKSYIDTKNIFTDTFRSNNVDIAVFYNKVPPRRRDQCHFVDHGDRAMKIRLKNPGRRAFVEKLAALGAAIPISGVLSGRAFAAESQHLTVVSYGGDYQASQNKAYFVPFQKLNPNVVVMQDSPESDAKLKAMVTAGRVTWDVAIVADNFGLDADSAWLEPIDYSVIDRSSFLPGYAGRYRVGADVEATVLAYRKDRFNGKAPAKLADFFDVKAFPGKRCAWKYASGGIFEAALVADGVHVDKLYPLDIPRAFRKLSTIKSQLIWWDTGAQSEQLIASGEADLGLIWSGRALHGAETAPIGLSWDQWLTISAYWVVPKGTKNKALAMEAIKLFTSPQAQSELTKYLPYGPTNKNAVNTVDARYKGNLPTDHFQNRIVINSDWWNANLKTVDQQFQQWLLT